MARFQPRFRSATADDPQTLNERWWQEHPMAYDWDDTHAAEEGSREYFGEVDRRFFGLIGHVAHPGWPDAIPFSSLEDFRKLSGRPVLEIGCGLGSTAEVLARCGCRLTAIDMTQRAVDLTSRRLTLAGLEACVLKMDAETMSFPDASFDYVWCWGVIHHSAEPGRIVDEIFRVLRPGGGTGAMIYHRNSTRYWITGVLRRGVLGLQLLNHSADAIQMQFTDGFYARHYSRAQAAELFRKFRVSMLLFDMDDLAIPFRPLRTTLRGALGVKKYWDLVRRVESKVGWALFVKGRKAEA